ncbi:hypothetical protein P8X34_10465 [Pyrococcus kukulkanii]|uniref:GerMN domain-containing protein n=1 Tax=Pyrococcus kukulkanii TaxID=1609559 RepID=A0ABV4T5V8_9EURY
MRVVPLAFFTPEETKFIPKVVEFAHGGNEFDSLSVLRYVGYGGRVQPNERFVSETRIMRIPEISFGVPLRRDNFFGREGEVFFDLATKLDRAFVDYLKSLNSPVMSVIGKVVFTFEGRVAVENVEVEGPVVVAKLATGLRDGIRKDVIIVREGESPRRELVSYIPTPQHELSAPMFI